MDKQNNQSDIVCLCDKVKVKMADGSIREICIVHPDEADFSSGKISQDSPVGQAILGAKTGEKKGYRVGEKQLEIEVLEIAKGVC